RVQTDAGDDGREPSSQVLHITGVAVGEPQPRFLNSVLCLAQRTQHAIGDRTQVSSMRLESPRQQLLLVHRSPFLATVRHSCSRVRSCCPRTRSGQGRNSVFTAFVVVTIAAAAANIYAALVDFIRADFVFDNMIKYGVPEPGCSRCRSCFSPDGRSF